MSKSLGIYIASLILFGSNGVVSSGIDLPSYDIVVIRTLLASALLGVLFLARRKRPQSLAHPRSFAFVAASGIFLGISWLLLFEAYNLVGVGMASLLYYCGPVLVMAVSPLLFGERLTRTRLGAFAIVLVGIVLVNVEGLGGTLPIAGLAYGGIAALCLAAMITCTKKAEGIDGLETTLIQMVFAFLVALVGTGAFHGLAMDIQASDWPALLVLGLVNTGLGCLLYFGAMGKLKAQTVAVCGYLEPISAVVLAIAFLGESLSGLQILGAVLVVAGAAAAELLPSIGKGLGKRLHRRPAIA